MKYAFILLLIALFSCNSSSKNHKMKPDTCFTQIEFENIYAGGYPAPPVLALAVRIIKDSGFDDGEDRLVHRPDTTYLVGYTMPIKDSTGKRNLKLRNDPLTDSTTVRYFPIRTDNLLHDYAHTHPLAAVATPTSTYKDGAHTLPKSSYADSMQTVWNNLDRKDSQKVAHYQHIIDSLKALIK